MVRHAPQLHIVRLAFALLSIYKCPLHLGYYDMLKVWIDPNSRKNLFFKHIWTMYNNTIYCGNGKRSFFHQYAWFTMNKYEKHGKFFTMTISSQPEKNQSLTSSQRMSSAKNRRKQKMRIIYK